MSTKKVAIGSDHRGVEQKEEMISYLNNLGYEVEDFGTNSDQIVDYPDFVHPVAEKVQKGIVDFGIILCGSGNGAAMTANKYPKVRAALAWNKKVAEMAKKHNNANILDIPADYVQKKDVLPIVEAYLSATFEGGRHQRRIEKIPIE